MDKTAGQQAPSLDLTPPKPINRRLGSPERRLLNIVETQFYLLRRMPTIAELALKSNYALSEIRYHFDNLQFKSELRRRGIPDSLDSPDELSSEQIAAAVVLNNFADKRSIKEKLAELGVDPNQYYGWLNNRAFKAFVRELSDVSLENVHTEAVNSFIRLIQKGNFSAIKYYFEITGFADNEESRNIKLLVERLKEAVQRHVKDPDTLAAIAADLRGPLELEETERGVFG